MTPSQKRKHKGSILVIDDEPAGLKLLFTILTQDGYAVHERQLDLESQLRFIKDTLPDLVLVDVRKPDMDGYAGNYFVSARAYQKPLVIDRGKQPLAETDGRPYAGCYVNASVEVWAQDNEFGRRINATLRGVQFLNDGDAFAGGAPATPDEFEDEGADESALA